MNLNRKTRKFSRLFHQHKMRLLAQFGPVLQITMADDFPNVSSLFTDPLFSLKIRQARVIKNKNPGEFIDRQRKGVGMGEEENRRFFLALPARSRVLADVFEKNEKKNRPTSVYRL